MRWILVLAVAAAAVWYVQAPPRGDADYRERAGQTTESVISNLETARLWLRGLREDRSTHEAARIGLADAERAARSTMSQFEDWDAPPQALDVRDRVSSAGARGAAALTTLRQRAHRDDWRGVLEGEGAVEAAITALDRLAKELPG